MTTQTEFADGKILASVEEGVGRVVFNQPEKRNAMSVNMWEGMGQALDLFAEDEGVRCVVLTNAAPWADLEPSPVGDPIRLLHHGAARETQLVVARRGRHGDHLRYQ